jgi:adenosine deaminase
VLNVERIDHGVRCLDSPELVERLAREQMALTVCPLSNIKLRVFDVMGSHSLRRLLDAGLAVTVNSDDPAYFGGYVNANYLAAFEALPLDAGHARQLARNSFERRLPGARAEARLPGRSRRLLQRRSMKL